MALRDAAKLPQDKDCGAKAAQARRTIEGRVSLDFRAVATVTVSELCWDAS